MPTASTLIAAESLPTAGEVWQPPALLPPLSGEIEVRTAWNTAISRAVSGAETRRGRRTRPSRSVRYTAGGWRDSEAVQVRQILADHTRAGSLLPLWPDGSALTADVLSSATVLPCDTASRRFQVGARVAVVRRGTGQLRLEDGFALGTIQTVGGSSITLTGTIGTAYPAGSIVVPILEAAIEVRGGGSYRNADLLSAGIEGEEIPGPACYEPMRGEKTWPTEYATLGTLPIVHLRSADGGCDVEAESIVEQERVGRGLIPTRGEGRPLMRWRVAARYLSRAAAWPLLGLFDAARGRLHAFWWVPPVRDFTPSAVNTGNIVVPAKGTLRSWTDRKAVAVVMRDGTAYVREISGSVSRGSGSDTITLATTLPALTLADVQAVTVAYKARFARDDIVERWASDRTVAVEAELQELEDDADKTIANLARLSSGVPAEDPGNACVPSFPPEVSLKIWMDAADAATVGVVNITGSDYLTWQNKGSAGGTSRETVAGKIQFPLETLNGRSCLGRNASTGAHGVGISSAAPSLNYIVGGSNAKFVQYLVAKFQHTGGSGGGSDGTRAFSGGSSSSHGTIGYIYRSSGSPGSRHVARKQGNAYGPSANGDFYIEDLVANFDTGYHIFKAEWFNTGTPDAGTNAFYIDNVLIGSNGDWTPFNWSTAGPIIFDTSAGEGAAGTAGMGIAELLVYEEEIVHGSDKDQEIMAYLRAKWGLS